ncbi:MAG: hypothetical protein WCV56_00180 [Candidatus Omnitrophota bacterium]
MGAKMSVFHKELGSGRWNEMPFCEQMANIGSEVSRAFRWREKDRKDLSLNSANRALELLDMTTRPIKKYARLKELSRVREVLVDFFYGSNEYGSSGISLLKYFDHFNYLARIGKG